MGKPIVKIENLVKRYDGVFILDIPRLEFQSGKIYSLVGSNGSGKTTLLNLLNLLEKPTKGEVIFSLNIHQGMCMVMEDPLLFHTTVFKNIAVGLKCRSVDKKMRTQMIEEALAMVGLEGFEKRYASDLSRGETQRVAIARTLVLKPEVLFLDEPFTNIDRKNVTILEKLIKTINKKYRTTIIFTTHDPLQAYRLSDEVISLVDGKIVKGSLENIFKGAIEEIDDLQFVRVSHQITVSVVTEKRGNVHISIAPEDIILSHKEILSSARNSFKGTVEKIQIEKKIARITIFIDEDFEIVALITETSYRDMKLFIDSDVFLTFKSTSVKVT